MPDKGRIFLLDKKGLSFDDVLLVPQYSDIKSRLDVDITTKLTKQITIDVPIISAAMDTVTEADLAIALAREGGVGFLHRFLSDEDTIGMISDIKRASPKFLAVPSVGIRDDIIRWVGELLNNGANAISIDIAHGHSANVLNTIDQLKRVFNDVQIIAGNVCTYEGASDLIEAGADAVKCGIGPGHACKTRIVTGFGVPNLTALCSCVEAAHWHNVPVIMDGGLKNSGDFVKALACGASSCMFGYLFSRTVEAPGALHIESGVRYKEYRGMASREAQVAFRGGLKKGTAAEGESTYVAITDTVQGVVESLCGGLRSGLTYCGARNINELQEKAVFMEISTSSMAESRPFIVDRKKETL